MTDNNYNMEWEQMRQQMNELKELLRSQQIVNCEMIKKAAKNNLSRERVKVIKTLVLAILLLPVYWIILPHFGMPEWFRIATVLFFLLCASVALYSLRHYISSDLLTNNLTTAALRMTAYKRFSYNWLKGAVPVIIVWICIFTYYAGQEDIALFYGACVGAVGGGIAGTIHFRKSIKRINTIIDQIEELKQADPTAKEE